MLISESPNFINIVIQFSTYEEAFKEMTTNQAQELNRMISLTEENYVTSDSYDPDSDDKDDEDIEFFYQMYRDELINIWGESGNNLIIKK